LKPETNVLAILLLVKKLGENICLLQTSESYDFSM
jgi:hypothetical protein